MGPEWMGRDGGNPALLGYRPSDGDAGWRRNSNGGGLWRGLVTPKSVGGWRRLQHVFVEWCF